MPQHATTPDFEHAEAHEGELNERDWAVLELVAKGLTNWEISERLGITLDGAKWYVSELLTTFGFATREDLAAYYRHRNRVGARLGRALRGLLALPFSRPLVGLGTMAGAVVVVAALLFVGNGGGTDSPGGIPPFELRAQIVVNDSSGDGRPKQTTSQLDWQFRDAGDWKWTVDKLSGLDSGTTVANLQNGSLLVYTENENSYQRTPMTGTPGGLIAPFSAFVGPLGLRDLAALTESLTANGSVQRVDVVGHEELLGRRTTVLEYSPTSRSSSNGVEESSGVGHIWLDEERMFVLRSDIQGSAAGSSYDLRVTSLRYGVPRNSVSTAFNLPSGAQEHGPGDGTSSGQSRALGPSQIGGAPALITVPPGFSKPSYVPQGYQSVSSGSSTNSFGETVGVEIGLATGTGHGSPFVSIQQRKRPDDLPTALVTTDTTTINGHTAYRGMDGAARTLAWAQDGVAILITSDTLPYEELERIATSMAP